LILFIEPGISCKFLGFFCVEYHQRICAVSWPHPLSKCENIYYQLWPIGPRPSLQVPILTSGHRNNFKFFRWWRCGEIGGHYEFSFYPCSRAPDVCLIVMKCVGRISKTWLIEFSESLIIFITLWWHFPWS
jgi:hypothetical protein